MGRKNLLAGLLEPTDADAPIAPVEPRLSAPPARPSVTSTAVGAVSRSMEDAQTVIDLDVRQIDPSFVSDRLEGAGGLQELTELIREHGQQVPILVRRHPDNPGRYQIVYGHRRWRAATALGRPVRALVRPLTDEELVIAQGQENSARADLTFIERALFAAALEDRGFGRPTIMAALSVDKFGLSKLIGSVTRIPRDIIEAIGPATRIGRDKWQAMVAALEQDGALETARELAASWAGSNKSADEKFQELARALKPSRGADGPSHVPTFKDRAGRDVAVLREATGFSNVRIDKRAAAGFGTFVFDRLPELYAAFEKAREEK